MIPAPAVVGLVLTLIVGLTGSVPDAGEKCRLTDRETCADGRDDGFELDGKRGAETDAEANPAKGPRAPVDPITVQTRYVPTCIGSGPDRVDVLCAEAVESCPQPDQVQVWVYRRAVDARIEGHNPPWVRVALPPSICRPWGSAPLIDPSIAIAALVQRDFQRVVVLKGVPEITPRPDTLVSIPTIFTTSAPASYDIPLTILGQPVVITATAATYTWHFGDGTSASTSVAGTQGRVEHVYRQSGSRGAYVVIEWTGTFRIAGGPVQQVNGTATTTGDPVAVEVKQARTELVGSSS